MANIRLKKRILLFRFLGDLGRYVSVEREPSPAPTLLRGKTHMEGLSLSLVAPTPVLDSTERYRMGLGPRDSMSAMMRDGLEHPLTFSFRSHVKNNLAALMSVINNEIGYASPPPPTLDVLKNRTAIFSLEHLNEVLGKKWWFSRYLKGIFYFYALV